jgi:ATP-binding cassette subfamily F protein 3
VKAAEKEMEKLSQSLGDVETKLADNSLYTDTGKDKLKTLLQQQADLKAALEQTESDWLEASEQLESAEADEE